MGADQQAAAEALPRSGGAAMTPDPALVAARERARALAAASPCFATRNQLATAHETLVIDLFRSAGWTIDRWGQALLTEIIRDALRRTPSYLRWAPDAVAVAGADVLLVDAKTEIRQDTAYFALEAAALDAHICWSMAMQHDVIYVWDDLTTSSVSDIQRGVAQGTVRSGPYRGNGSGTPFWLVPKTSTQPLDTLIDRRPPPFEGAVA